MVLWASGTHIAYAGVLVSAYVPATRCPILTWRMRLPSGDLTYGEFDLHFFTKLLALAEPKVPDPLPPCAAFSEPTIPLTFLYAVSGIGYAASGTESGYTATRILRVVCIEVLCISRHVCNGCVRL